MSEPTPSNSAVPDNEPFAHQPHLDNREEPTLTEQFIADVTHDLPDGVTTALCSRPNPEGGFRAVRADKAKLVPGENWYIGNSAVRIPEQKTDCPKCTKQEVCQECQNIANGKISFSRANFYGLQMAMLDDIGWGAGSKVSLDEAVEWPEPTYRIETSPGNHQYIYVLSELATDWKKATILCRELSEKTGSDKGAKNIVRWARLPGGSNNKPEHKGTAGESGMKEDDNGFPITEILGTTEGLVPPKYTIEELAEKFGIDLDAKPESPATVEQVERPLREPKPEEEEHYLNRALKALREATHDTEDRHGLRYNAGQKCGRFISGGYLDKDVAWSHLVTASSNIMDDDISVHDTDKEMTALREGLRDGMKMPHVEVNEYVEGDFEDVSDEIEGDWEEPEPLAADRERKEYPRDALPTIIKDAADEVKKYTQAPYPMIVQSALAALSVAGQGLIDVKRTGGLTGPASLFQMSIAESGERKSTLDGLFMNPITFYEDSIGEMWGQDIAEHEAAVEIWEAEIRGLKEAIKAAKKAGDNDEKTASRKGELVLPFTHKSSSPWTFCQQITIAHELKICITLPHYLMPGRRILLPC